MREAREDFVLVDGRTYAEFNKMNIPDGICCPNGELALRIHDLVPDPKTRIVVNCAGRTRSIIGAQTLIDFGVPNPVVALENGTQGWLLAGLALEHGATRRYADQPAGDLNALRARARKVADKHGVGFVTPAQAAAWRGDTARTTFLLDVRTAEEVAAQAVPGFVHAPGGQLIQATDQWVGVKGARLLLIDAEEVRAPMVAAWLRQLGHEAYVLEGGVAAAASVGGRSSTSAAITQLKAPSAVSAAQMADMLAGGKAQIIDLRPGMTYRKGHIPQAVWSIRSRLAAIADPSKTVVLVADEPELATLAAVDLKEAGCRDVRMLDGGYAAWQTAGHPVTATPGEPADVDCIDFLFFTAKRHDGGEAGRAASQQYLTWEIGLIDQLDEQERGVFRIAHN
jgi:rhodanese-related sulfurtransferase